MKIKRTLLKRLVLYTVFVFFTCVTVKSQSIYKSWYCKESNLCFIIQKNGYSSINEFENIKFKLKKDRFRILLSNTSFSWLTGRYLAWYSIDKLTEDTLIITRISTCPIFDELLPDKTMIFTECSSADCTNKWMDNAPQHPR